jgi:hypothetical protein
MVEVPDLNVPTRLNMDHDERPVKRSWAANLQVDLPLDPAGTQLDPRSNPLSEPEERPA